MNARAYFTILRPGRTLFASALYVGFVYVWLITLFRAPAAEALWLTLALFGPAVLGILLLGPLHEVMHRSAFPLLPDARRQLRRWHLRALSVVALLFFIPAVLFVDTIPAAALLGLIAAGLSLPLLTSRRRVMGQLRLHSFVFILAAIAVAAAGRPALIAACQHAPWWVLIAGFAVAYGCVRIGFSATQTGNRWRDPEQFCLQSRMPFVGTEIMLHAQQQLRQRALEGNDRPIRQWDTVAVGPTLREWVRVTHHARFGQMSRLRLFGRLTLAGILLMPLILGVFFVASKLISDDTLFADIYRLLVAASPVAGLTRQPPVGMVLLLSPLAAYGFALLAAVNAATPTLPFPIARDRVARALCLDAARLGTGVYAANFLGTALTLFIASRFAGEPFGGGVVQKLVASYAVLPATLLFGLGFLSLRPGVVRFSAAIAFGLAGVLAVVGANLYFTSFLLSPTGLLACAATTALSGWGCWRVIRRHYQTCDLTHAGETLRKLGIGLA